MNIPHQTISSILELAFTRAFAELGLGADVPVRLVEATNPEFGDYQVNGAMGAAKQLKTNPRELSGRIIEKVKQTDIFLQHDIVAKLEIAGPGFINITLNDTYLANFVGQINPANKFGVDYLQHKSEKVVVDLSSPNLAKEMHVGHLRSTVIGDALAKIFEYMGDSVIRQNHVGDWGTQFGMLIAYLEDELQSGNLVKRSITDLEVFYRQAKTKFDTDENFAKKSRQYVVILQNTDKIYNGDFDFQGWYDLDEATRNDLKNGVLSANVKKYWDYFKSASLNLCQEVYDELKVNLSASDEYGESKYNPQLPSIVKRLEEQNLLVESNGAKCVFFADGDLPGGEETPYIVQKQDGGYLYSTTDLAAVDYRVHTLHSDRNVYVVDARQSFHFKQLFVVAKKAGFANPETKLEHTPFGTMMNEDGKPFKTRDGGTVKLIDLITEAKIRAKKIVDTRNQEWSEEEKTHLAQLLAIDSIKYSDLSKNRNSDYIFSFDKMLAFDGNTAPYLLYAYTRIQSVIKKADIPDMSNYTISITQPAEHKLALQLSKFADSVNVAQHECFPHYVCQYLYNLAGLFMQFYEVCPILKAEDINQRHSRLALANLTAEILKTGLDILGIQVVDRM